MAGNNLRIIYDNLADNATITTASGSSSVNNLKLNAKGKVWSAGASSATINVSWSGSKVVTGVILAFTNLTDSATISVNGSTPAKQARPWSDVVPYGTESIPAGSNTYAYGGGSYARYWVPVNEQTPSTSCSIAISNSTAIEVSRLIVGTAWSPKYNTSFGVSKSVKDLSAHERLLSGDLYTTRGTKFDTLTFDLKYLTPADRAEMVKIMKNNGIYKPIFVSVFPDDAEANKERDYQIYGKLSQLDALVHPIFDMYSTQLTIEEI